MFSNGEPIFPGSHKTVQKNQSWVKRGTQAARVHSFPPDFFLRRMRFEHFHQPIQAAATGVKIVRHLKVPLQVKGELLQSNHRHQQPAQHVLQEAAHKFEDLQVDGSPAPGFGFTVFEKDLSVFDLYDAAV